MPQLPYTIETQKEDAYRFWSKMIESQGNNDLSPWRGLSKFTWLMISIELFCIVYICVICLFYI